MKLCFFSLPSIKGKGEKNSFEFSANCMFVDPLTFLYPGSNLAINGRKSQGSGVRLRTGLSCAVQWKEEMAAEQVKCVQNSPEQVQVCPTSPLPCGCSYGALHLIFFLYSMLK